jgi:hypothetical protein
MAIMPRMGSTHDGGGLEPRYNVSQFVDGRMKAEE